MRGRAGLGGDTLVCSDGSYLSSRKDTPSMRRKGKLLQVLGGDWGALSSLWVLSHIAVELQSRGGHITACQWFSTVHKLVMVSVI